MIIDGISFNVDFAKNSKKENWVERHIGFFGRLSKGEREHLSTIYDRLTAEEKKPDGKGEKKPSEEEE